MKTIRQRLAVIVDELDTAKKQTLPESVRIDALAAAVDEVTLVVFDLDCTLSSLLNKQEKP